MAATFDVVQSRQDQVSIPTIWIAVAISIVLHTLLLWSWPSLLPTELLSPAEDDLPGKKQGSLAVRLAAPPAPSRPPVAAVQAPAAPAHREMTKPAAPSRAAPVPRVLTQERPSSTNLASPPPKPAAAPAPPAGGDFASFVEAKRREREGQDRDLPQQQRPAPEPEPQPAETEQERHNREVARSLGLNRSTGLGGDRNRGGGIFQVVSINERKAIVDFYGWNKTIERKILQSIEVNRGDQPSIEIAVVRRMIEIIRMQTTGTMTWESLRLGHDVELSARVADTAKLEAFLMEEFFWDKRKRP
ncbi:MAG: hypothetical protein ACRET8_10615 [Burkholderiales bacterium]